MNALFAFIKSGIRKEGKNEKKCPRLCILFYCFFLLVGIRPTTVLARPAIKADTLTIMHITDTHICNLKEYHPVFVQKRQQYGNGVESLLHFFATMPVQMKADLVVNTGDNIDFYQATTLSGDMLDTQVEQYARLVELCPVKLFCILGNHDIQQYRIDSDSTYVAQKYNAAQAKAAWIRNIACFRNGTYYSRTYRVGDTSYRLIFLDNSYRAQDQPVPFVMDGVQLEWLNYQLQEFAEDVEILFMHIPLPLEDANKDGNSFSKAPIKLDASSIASNMLLKLLNDYSSVRLLVTGHGHKNIIEDAVFPKGHKLTQIETDAFGQDPQNWRLIKLTEKEILISFPGAANVQYTFKSK